MTQSKINNDAQWNPWSNMVQLICWISATIQAAGSSGFLAPKDWSKGVTPKCLPQLKSWTATTEQTPDWSRLSGSGRHSESIGFLENWATVTRMSIVRFLTRMPNSYQRERDGTYKTNMSPDVTNSSESEVSHIYIYIYIYGVVSRVNGPPPPWYGGGGRDSDTVYTLYIHSM